MWVSLRGKPNCGNKLNDVMCHPIKQRSRSSQKDAQRKNIDLRTGNKAVLNIAGSEQHASPSSSFEELNVGETSRKVIEMILAAYLTSPAKKLRKIQSVLKVKNSHKIVERFEKYRDLMKQKAKERRQKHQRSLVDGNELLCFYVTTITCHDRHSKRVSGLCQDPSCNACRAVGSSFDKNKFGIEMCLNSEALSENVSEVSQGKNMKRAVIICRVIAGRTRSMDDNKMSENEYDSIRNRGFYPKSEYLILNNPTAVLPCFIIVLN